MIDLHALDKYRVYIPKIGEPGDGTAGAFVLQHHGVTLRVLASAGDGWDHVSVSTTTRTPTWDEMEFVKRQFFKPTEVAMQLHVPPKDHINCHPFTLHLWRPHRGRIPLPPRYMV